ncbi:hypothetical protein BP6252_12591 [Coleophoma cylindrospora]|uniref:WAC domain-containing protein n=1 Tax=Coleophoma cylindrospora TaxID=1849047 RepID=A0A3D8QDJ7_9HELO|nr:hypothetical protein BP6252_12591 [Coleophoma cylindrospora]
MTGPLQAEAGSVWVIEKTGEIFVEYEAYLSRMDFYKQRRFICQITGHSGLTFFDALKSELEGAQEVESSFPEALKGPILRRVQFQTISRIDTLVDLVYEEFRSDYYPGESVTVHVVTGERLTGIVRDKTRFGAKILPNGDYSKPFSRYFVSLDNRPSEEAVVDDSHISRDRKIFTKQVLRSFIKKTVTREAWTGAPWLVKHDVAVTYHIDTRVPPHLRYESKAAERKQQQAQKKSGPDYEGMVGSFPGQGAAPLPTLKPAPKSHKSKQQQIKLAQSKQQSSLHPAPDMHPNPPLHYFPPSQYQTHPQFVSHTFQANPFQGHQVNPFQSNGGHLPPPPPPRGHHPLPPGQQYVQTQDMHYGYPPMQPQQLPPAPPPPPPIKYPIEDLQVPQKSNPAVRPAIKFFSQDTPSMSEEEASKITEGNGILMKSVGPLLECWNTFNVYCEILKIDSFTFDDFVEAMQFSSDEVDCELFVEAHCAALKLLVSAEADGGKLQITLPEMASESDDEDSDDDSSPPTPTPEPEPKPKGRATRSSLAKAEAEALRQQQAEAEAAAQEPEIKHRAEEMQAEQIWTEKLAKRDFKNGGWQSIMVGFLYQLSKKESFEKSCTELLEKLAPLNMPPTAETARIQYGKLDVNFRVQALELVCLFMPQTKAIRGYMEECSEQMTGFRKEKIKWQRERKEHLEALRVLNEERKIQLPDNMPPSPVRESAVPTTNGDTAMADASPEIKESEDEVMDTDDDPHVGRSLRRANDRAAERQRKREAEEVKKAKAEAAAKLPKQTKQFTKLLKDIAKKEEEVKACEKEIAVLDNDLREADCPRTRYLGKDRFWNRYYWFERNGMPYAGLPDSSTAEAEYANGRLWVQGPDEMERLGYIDLEGDWLNEYRMKFDMTPRQRKEMEEGSTNVFHARQWGFYDMPEEVDKLIAWLDPRGFNEVKFKKEIMNYRDRIVERMEKRNEYLKKADDEAPETGKRMSTRTKHQQEVMPYRCLQWHNTMAVHELGHLHSEQPRARKPAKKVKIPTPEIEERETRSESKTKKQKIGKGGR